MLRSVSVLALAAGLALSGPVLAQSSSNTGSGSSNSQANASSANQGHNVLTVNKVKQDLEGAGFTNVQVLSDAFVVQANNKDGNPVVMMIGPNSVTAFEALSPKGSSTGSTGSGGMGSAGGGSSGSTGTGSQHK